jgi:hypothetical protein
LIWVLRKFKKGVEPFLKLNVSPPCRAGIKRWVVGADSSVGISKMHLKSNPLYQIIWNV